MTDEIRTKRRVPMPVLVIVFSLLAGFLILVGSNRRNVKAGLNTPIQYDDFVFRVESVKVLDGKNTAQATYEVTLRVDNKAKRVAFNFDDARTVIVDGAGTKYGPTAPAPIATIPAGSHDVHVIQYDVPREIKDPRLKVLASDAVGDFLEFVIFGEKEFSLPEPGELAGEPH